MSVLKKIERIERMHEMIRYKRTGTPEQFASKMGVSVSLIYYLINELKTLGAPIIFCKYRDSYTYEYPVEFKFGFELPTLSKKELLKVVGGTRIVPMYAYFQISGLRSA